ncbi:MAG TPA: hypothetical protein V6D48_03105, partial [Oculatellaceae cyanobacterium]
NLRKYHAKLDIMNALEQQDQQDLDWQVKEIQDWKKRKHILVKELWFGGNKQWVPMDTVCAET